jgi:thiosulfate/3-mercaptopyruvate sulfurtransferase
MIGADARVDAAWIASHINDPLVRVIEIDVSAAAYKLGHIPGAVLWNAYTDLRRDDYLPIAADEMQALLRKSGVSETTAIVFYGYGALLGYWLMSSLGHENLYLMDGPREQWTAAGGEWSIDEPPTPQSTYVLENRRRFSSSKEDVLRAMAEPGQLLLDTRSKDEYDGDRFWPSGAAAGNGRAGHVPGAMHFPVGLLRTHDGQFKSENAMRQIVLDLGIRQDDEIITYCTIGNRASQVWYALTHILGYERARVYYESWVEWGFSTSTPVERSNR